MIFARFSAGIKEGAESYPCEESGGESIENFEITQRFIESEYFKFYI